MPRGRKGGGGKPVGLSWGGYEVVLLPPPVLDPHLHLPKGIPIPLPFQGAGCSNRPCHSLHMKREKKKKHYICLGGVAIIGHCFVCSGLDVVLISAWQRTPWGNSLTHACAWSPMSRCTPLSLCLEGRPLLTLRRHS